MTVGEWLDVRTSGVPPHLVAHVRDALGDALTEDAGALPERCVEAAERIVAALLRTGRTGRASALSLLAADALVTYAFEAAADAPEHLPARAAWAMQVLATL